MNHRTRSLTNDILVNNVRNCPVVSSSYINSQKLEMLLCFEIQRQFLIQILQFPEIGYLALKRNSCLFYHATFHKRLKIAPKRFDDFISIFSTLEYKNCAYDMKKFVKTLDFAMIEI